MKKWIVMLSLAMFGTGAFAQASPAAPPASADKPAAAPMKDGTGKAKVKKVSKKKKNHAPPAKDPMKNKGA